MNYSVQLRTDRWRTWVVRGTKQVNGKKTRTYLRKTSAEFKKFGLRIGMTYEEAYAALENYKKGLKPSKERIRLNNYFNRYKRSAANRCLEFTLKFSQFRALVTSPCRYCGITKSPFLGIDRADNNLGYTPSNSVSCCITCNRAKMNLSLGEWKEWLKRIINFNAQGEPNE